MQLIILNWRGQYQSLNMFLFRNCFYHLKKTWTGRNARLFKRVSNQVPFQDTLQDYCQEAKDFWAVFEHTGERSFIWDLCKMGLGDDDIEGGSLALL